MFTALCVSVTWLACVLVSFSMCVRLSVSVCVGLFRGGFLAVKWPRAVRVGAGSKHPVLQEEIPRVGKVCGVALPPGR